MWYLRYQLSHRDLEEMFAERGLGVEHSTINRWMLVYAPRSVIASVAGRETYVKIRGNGAICTEPSTTWQFRWISC